MKYFLFGVFAAATLSLAALPVFAMKQRQVATLSTPGTERTLLLPQKAAHSPVISLGTAVDPQSGKTVEGFAIVRYKDGHAKPSGCNNDNKCQGWEDATCGDCTGGGGGGGDTSSCYGFLAKDAKWKTVEPWIVNPSNLDGLSSAFVFSNLSSNISAWEDAADGLVDATPGADILGSGSITSDVLVADTNSPDGVNEILFADISDAGAIGVTIVWGIFNGPPFSRELVEWDQVYDDVDFDWTEDATLEPAKMDFWNISIHELGHSVGLADLYTDTCVEETMYGYGTEGEVKKRTLEAGDITGIDKLY